MKCFAKLLLLSFSVFLLLQAVALADTDKIGTEYTIDSECTFKIKNAQEYDVFFNQESGAGKQWIVVSFELLNWRTDSFYVKTETAAQLIYDGDFEFTPEYLWFNPEGSYYATNAHNGASLMIFCLEDNEIFGYLEQDTHPFSSPAGLKNNYFDYAYAKIDANPMKNHGYGYSGGCYYDPINITFVHENGVVFKSLDNSKTILDPLVQRTYHYVFWVPDLVAEGEGMRELVFTVCDEEYAFRF